MIHWTRNLVVLAFILFSSTFGSAKNSLDKNERIQLDRGFMLMAENEVCPNGLDITSESRCLEAQIAAESMGLNPSRDVLLVGNWQGVPYRCSAQAGTDNPEYKDNIHWNTNEDTDNSRFLSGEFRMICDIGEGIGLLIW